MGGGEIRGCCARKKCADALLVAQLHLLEGGEGEGGCCEEERRGGVACSNRSRMHFWSATFAS